MQILPSELIQNSVQNYYAKISTLHKGIYTLTVFALFMVVALLPIIKVDVSTQARGIVRSPEENTSLQSMIYGKVDYINLNENSFVSVGDTLLTFNSEKLDEQIFKLQSEIELYTSYQNDLVSLKSRNTTNIKTQKYQAQLKHYQSQISAQESKFFYSKEEFERQQLLFSKEVISEKEYLVYKKDFDTQNKLQNSINEDFNSKWSSDLSNINQSIIEYKSRIKQLEKEKLNYIITAPVSGIVMQLKGIQKGSFVSPATTIATISKNDIQIIECYVSPQDIGYLYENQAVIFQFDSYNYNQWGMAKGRIQWISKDIIFQDNKAVFLVRCTLNDSYLTLKNGYKGKFKKGMTLTARFKLAKRSLWQLLFDKVDNWINPSCFVKE